LIGTGPAATIFVLMFASLVATAPYLTFGALLRRGRNPTRMLPTVLVSIGGFVTLILMVPPYASCGLLIRILAPALIGGSVAIVALLFARASNEFFTGRR
jgi:hypothetical protein